ncbi:aminoglycoside phosphotransferase family protein [Timonella sp. A28]|uniref:aminoglycoside phosphotransferase family protein n=1 Tax=Timonella sp. A28 TaxID=3442640 RepID=UPI003EB7B253
MSSPDSFSVSETSANLVHQLVREHLPAFAGFPVSLAAQGWDNIMFRVGAHHAARFPQRMEALPLLHNEIKWLATAAAPLTVSVPTISHVVAPSSLFPHPWTVVTWIDGSRGLAQSPQSRDVIVRELGQQLAALHRPAPQNAPRNPYRGGPLTERNTVMRERTRSLPELNALNTVWEAALSAPEWKHDGWWCHGDLHPGNYVLHEDHKLAGIIDFGDLCAGDPALDLMTAWTSFTETGRSQFFDSYFAACDKRIREDSGIIDRARGWAALSMVSGVLTSPLSTPDFVDMAQWTLNQLLHEQ